MIIPSGASRLRSRMFATAYDEAVAGADHGEAPALHAEHKCPVAQRADVQDVRRRRTATAASMTGGPRPAQVRGYLQDSVEVEVCFDPTQFLERGRSACSRFSRRAKNVADRWQVITMAAHHRGRQLRRGDALSSASSARHRRFPQRSRRSDPRAIARIVPLPCVDAPQGEHERLGLSSAGSEMVEPSLESTSMPTRLSVVGLRDDVASLLLTSRRTEPARERVGTRPEAWSSSSRSLRLLVGGDLALEFVDGDRRLQVA